MSNLEQFRNFVHRRPMISPDIDPQIMYAALGMVSEAGEAGDVIKKISRGDSIDPIEFVLEAGDVLYYMQQILSKLGFSLEQVIKWHEDKHLIRDKHGKGPDKKILMDHIHSELN